MPTLPALKMFSARHDADLASPGGHHAPDSFSSDQPQLRIPTASVVLRAPMSSTGNAFPVMQTSAGISASIRFRKSLPPPPGGGHIDQRMHFFGRRFFFFASGHGCLNTGSPRCPTRLCQRSAADPSWVP